MQAVGSLAQVPKAYVWSTLCMYVCMYVCMTVMPAVGSLAQVPKAYVWTTLCMYVCMYDSYAGCRQPCTGT